MIHNNNSVNKTICKNKKNVKFKPDNNLNNVITIVNNDYLFEFKNEIWYSQNELDLIKSVFIQETKALMLKYNGLTFSQAIILMDEISMCCDNVKPSYPTPSYPTPSYPTPSYLTPSYSTLSYSTPSYLTQSYLIPSYSTPSYPNELKRSKTVLFDLNKLEFEENVFNINGYGYINSLWEE